jgi:hypothetical protein
LETGRRSLALTLVLKLQRPPNTVEHDQSAMGTLQRLARVGEDVGGFEQFQPRAFPNPAVE